MDIKRPKIEIQTFEIVISQLFVMKYFFDPNMFNLTDFFVVMPVIGLLLLPNLGARELR